MTYSEMISSINEWNQWVSSVNDPKYDIALLKIWIKFEKYISELFVSYCIGNKSEKEYIPNLKIRFQDEEQLNAFLRDGSKKYVEYFDKIEKLSKHIFYDSPFEVIFLDVNNKKVYDQVKSIRNYIAHESGESKTKMINQCFSGNAGNFVEPNIFLVKKEPTTRKTYYAYYVEAIANIALLLIDPPTS